MGADRRRRKARKSLEGPSRAPGEGVDWDPLEVERMRPRGRLRSLTLRLGVEQIAEARRVSSLTGVPYQVVLRQWIAHGASVAQRARHKAERKPPR
jgi:hypothetical protein